MSESKKSPLEKFRDDLSKVNFETFQKVSTKFLEMVEAKRADVEILPNFSSVSYSDKAMKWILEEYNINRESLSQILATWAYILHDILADSENETYTELKDDTLISKAKDFFNFVKQTPQFQKIKAKYLVIKYAKSNFFREIDWEINIKNSQKPSMDEPECVAFPFAVVKLCIERTRTPEKHISAKPIIITMELSLPDAVELSKEFANIAEKLRKLTVTS